jgi:hypothetical protein
MTVQGEITMYAIEFQAKIKNGSIEIPEEYRRRLREQGSDNAVRVIILTTERETSTDFIDQLLANPIAASDFIPFTREGEGIAHEDFWREIEET